MQKRTKSNHYMELNSAELKSIIDTPNRSYHLFVLFSTTDPAAKCGLCPRLTAMYSQMVAAANTAGKTCSMPTFFAYIDLVQNTDIFRQLRIQKVPDLAYFGPEDSEPALVSTQSPTDFNQFVEFVSKNSGCRLGGSILKEAQPSSDHSVLFACTVIALTVAGLIVFGRLSLFDAVRNHNLWSGIVMGATYYLVSGALWSRVRKGPFMGHDMYFSPGISSQLGIEWRIIGLIYLVVSAVLIAQPVISARIKDTNRRRIAAMLATGLVVVGQAALIRAFSIKMPNYPFKYGF